MFGNHSIRSNQKSPFSLPGPDRFNKVPSIEKNISGNEGGIGKHIERFQQVLSVVERTTPYIEEYGPFIKNLPQMYRMIKAFKSLESEDETDGSGSAQEESVTETQREVNKEQPFLKNIKADGLSKPKLFI